MTSRRRSVCSTSALIGFSTVLAACGGTPPDETPQATPETQDVEIVTVTEFADGTVLGPDDEAAGSADELEAAGAGDVESDASHDDESSALAPDEFEFIGTVEKQSTEEVLNGLQPPNPSVDLPTNRYYILVLDSPVEVTLNKAGDPDYSQMNERVSLGAVTTSEDDSARWDPYVGKRIRLIAAKDDLSYPSDTSLPMKTLRLWQNGRVEEL